MKKILSIILAIILASTLALPAFAAPTESSPDCITVTIEANPSVSFFSRVINSIFALFRNIFNWIFGFNNTEPPIDDPKPVDPDPFNPDPPPEYEPEIEEPAPKNPEEGAYLTYNDPNKDVPNGYPVSGSLDHSATTREVAYEIIYDCFKDTDGFNPGTEYTVRETNNPKVNKAVNFILDNNCGDALVYVGISKVDENGTIVNICPESLVTGAFLEAILFSIPTVSRLVVLNDDPYAPLSKEQVEYIVKYAAIYTRYDDEKGVIGSSGALTRQEAYEIFKRVFSDYDAKLFIPDSVKVANVDFLDYLALKFSGFKAVYKFGAIPNMPVSPQEVQFIAELHHLLMYESLVCYEAEVV